MCAIIRIVVAMPAASAGAQQYITDDAAITEFRACQIQMWQGQRSSWVLPVCTPMPRVELSLGFIAVWKDGADGHFEYAAQVKTAFRPLATDTWGVGFVAGTGRDPAFAGTGDQTISVYAYVPTGISLARDGLVFHQNTGVLAVRQDGAWRNAITWAARADVRLAGRVGLGVVGVVEVFGAESLGLAGAGAPAEYQAGLRTWIRPDRVQADLSYGRALRGSVAGSGAGVTIGLTLVTPPFL